MPVALRGSAALPHAHRHHRLHCCQWLGAASTPSLHVQRTAGSACAVKFATALAGPRVLGPGGSRAGTRRCSAAPHPQAQQQAQQPGLGASRCQPPAPSAPVGAVPPGGLGGGSGGSGAAGGSGRGLGRAGAPPGGSPRALGSTEVLELSSDVEVDDVQQQQQQPVLLQPPQQQQLDQQQLPRQAPQPPPLSPPCQQQQQGPLDSPLQPAAGATTLAAATAGTRSGTPAELLAPSSVGAVPNELRGRESPAVPSPAPAAAQAAAAASDPTNTDVAPLAAGAAPQTPPLASSSSLLPPPESEGPTASASRASAAPVGAPAAVTADATIAATSGWGAGAAAPPASAADAAPAQLPARPSGGASRQLPPSLQVLQAATTDKLSELQHVVEEAGIELGEEAAQQLTEVLQRLEQLEEDLTAAISQHHQVAQQAAPEEVAQQQAAQQQLRAQLGEVLTQQVPPPAPQLVQAPAVAEEAQQQAQAPAAAEEVQQQVLTWQQLLTPQQPQGSAPAAAEEVQQEVLTWQQLLAQQQGQGQRVQEGVVAGAAATAAAAPLAAPATSGMPAAATPPWMRQPTADAPAAASAAATALSAAAAAAAPARAGVAPLPPRVAPIAAAAATTAAAALPAAAAALPPAPAAAAAPPPPPPAPTPAAAPPAAAAAPPPPEAAALGSTKLWALFVLALSYVHQSTTGFALPALMPMVEADLHLSDFQGAALTSGYSYLYALALIPVGVLADSVERPKLLAVGLALWSTLSIAAGGARGFGELLAMRVGFAAAQATQNPVSFSLIPDLFPANKSTALAAYNCAIYLGRALSFASVLAANRLAAASGGGAGGALSSADDDDVVGAVAAAAGGAAGEPGVGLSMVPLDQLDLQRMSIIYTAGDMVAVTPVYNYNFHVIAYEAAAAGSSGGVGTWRTLLQLIGIPGFFIAALMLASVADPRTSASKAATDGNGEDASGNGGSGSCSTGGPGDGTEVGGAVGGGSDGATALTAAADAAKGGVISLMPARWRGGGGGGLLDVAGGALPAAAALPAALRGRAAALVRVACAAARAPARNVSALASLPAFRAVTLGAALNDLGSYALIAWQSTFYERVYHLDASVYAPVLAVILPVGGILGGVGGGLLADWLSVVGGRYWLTAGASILAAPFIAKSILAGSSQESFLALLVGFALSEAWRAPSAVMIRTVAPQELGSTASALYLCARNLIGGLGPVAVAKLSEAVGLQRAMLLAPVCYLVSGLTFFVAERIIEDMGRLQQQQQQLLLAPLPQQPLQQQPLQQQPFQQQQLQPPEVAQPPPPVAQAGGHGSAD